MLDFLLYFLTMILGTLGIFVACGLVVYWICRWFSRLIGSGSRMWFRTTSMIGTPVHELGHTVMCKIFSHRITSMKLWNPRPTNGVYGYVEHSYSKRNLWARFGNLFVGMGPLFSGLGVTLLALWLCFPTLWAEYLSTTSSLAVTGETGATFAEIARGVFVLIRGIPNAFRETWLKSTLGLLVILSISLHISLSPQDIKSSVGALPIYGGLMLVIALATYWTPLAPRISSGLAVLSLRLFSLFALVIGFALVWLAFAALIRLVKIILKLF
jgi:hypothetical protein